MQPFIRTILGSFALLPYLAVAQPEVKLESAMVKIDRDTPWTSPVATTPFSITAVRNEHELLQVLLRAEGFALQNCTVAISDFQTSDGSTIPASAVTMRRAHYIFLEKFVAKQQYLPDALLPYDGTKFAVEANQNQAIYLDIHIPKDAAAGLYRATVTVSADQEVFQFPVEVCVRPITLSDTPTFESAFALWGEQDGVGTWKENSQLLATYPDIQPHSPESRALYERIFWFMADYRMAPDDLPVPVDSLEAERFFQDPRVVSWRIPYNSEKPEEFVKLTTMLRNKGLMNRTYVYTIDEPLPEKYGEAIQYSETLHKLAPDARFVLTTHMNRLPNLEGHVDIWCPILNQYDYEYYKSRRALGEVSWWYTCCGPGQPFPTYLLHDDAISPRMLDWLQAKYNVSGMLYWAVNIWKKYDLEKNEYVDRDLWNDPSAFPGTNGDGYLLYPAPNPEDDPIPSLRFESIRQGHEDFDLMSLYRTLLAGTAKKLGVDHYSSETRLYEFVNPIAESMTKFTKDPLVLDARRIVLFDEIENLTNGIPALIESTVMEGAVNKNTPLHFTVTTIPDAVVSVKANGQELDVKKAERTFMVTVPAISEDTELEFAVAANGQESVYRRTYLYRPYETKELKLLNWGDPDQIKKHELSNVSLTPVAGSATKAFCFAPNVDFPSVFFSTGQKTTPFHFLRVIAANPSEQELKAVLKLHTSNGMYDGLRLNLQPHETKEFLYEFPPSDAGFPADVECDKIQLWMFNAPEPRELVLEDLTLLSAKPE